MCEGGKLLNELVQADPFPSTVVPGQSRNSVEAWMHAISIFIPEHGRKMKLFCIG
jgi:hypothetical protein